MASLSGVVKRCPAPPVDRGGVYTLLKKQGDHVLMAFGSGKMHRGSAIVVPHAKVHIGVGVKDLFECGNVPRRRSIPNQSEQRERESELENYVRSSCMKEAKKSSGGDLQQMINERRFSRGRGCNQRDDRDGALRSPRSEELTMNKECTYMILSWRRCRLPLDDTVGLIFSVSNRVDER